jgi:hypothetical protein
MAHGDEGHHALHVGRCAFDTFVDADAGLDAAAAVGQVGQELRRRAVVVVIGRVGRVGPAVTLQACLAGGVEPAVRGTEPHRLAGQAVAVSAAQRLHLLHAGHHLGLRCRRGAAWLRGAPGLLLQPLLHLQLRLLRLRQPPCGVGRVERVEVLQFAA